MSDTVTTAIEAIAKDVRERFDAFDRDLSDKLSDQALTEMVRGLLPELINELADSGEHAELIRKLRFGSEPEDRPVVGSTYAVRGMSVADIEFLYDLQRGLAGQKRVDGNGFYDGPSEELSRTFEAVTTARYLDEAQLRRMDQASVESYFQTLARSQPALELFHGTDREHMERGAYELTAAYRRAMDTAESGYGSQLIGAQYVGQLWEAPRRLGRIFPLIEQFEMTDATAYLPVEADLPELLFVGESTASNSSNYTTSKTGSNRVQVTPKKFVIHQMHSGEMEEDSIIPFLPFLRAQAAKSLAHYADSLVLNGDTTNAGTGNINLDDADPADTKHYLAFDGIRHAALVDNTNNRSDAGGALTYADFFALKGLMVDRAYLMDWGHPDDPSDLVYIADPSTADAAALLDEVRTVDKYGPGATVLTGEQAKVGQHPLVSSVAMSLTEADGKVSDTGSNNTKGQVTAFNRRGFVTGWRRQVRTEVERLPATDQTRIVHSLRVGFGRFTPTGSAAGIEATATLYNITV